MATDLFMQITNINGESSDKGHKDQIDVLAWGWGMSQSGSMHIGGGGGSGKVNVNDLSFTKWVDLASPYLMLACCKGTHFPKAELFIRKAGDKPLEYMTITMENVLVSSVSTGGSGGEDKFTENVTLNFAKVKVKYIQQTALGAGDKKPDMSWDIPANDTY